MGVCGYNDREQSLKHETRGTHGSVVERKNNRLEKVSVCAL